ncbi:Dihydromonacolin L monooxygenase LovA 7 [Colletotrichum chlorophyti]|uniref:Dihydromonacolin L monooxygenase LovA 7 n=1 Tax=Colletotrichum chlorophyti TaxID=708187 RepID=A0A1Q8RTA2_9PEZI|nr:Dihydromonacolin L monooxygenase LovA 7 [Colletotrichum chlorophyti]
MFCVGIILICLFISLCQPKPSDKLPYLNPPKAFGFLEQPQKNAFLFNVRSLMATARLEFPGQPYRLFTNVGETIVVPSEFADGIRNEPGLSLMGSLAEKFHSHLPGFEGFAAGVRPDGLVPLVVKKHITKIPNQITGPLSSETQYAVDLIFGKSSEWHESKVKGDMLDLISRLSSRVFLGAELCRNEAWLSIIKSYTVNAFQGAEMLHGYPSWLRFVVQWSNPQCKVLRQQVSDANKIIRPVLQGRRNQRQKAQRNGELAPSYDDGIDWLEEESNGRDYDATGAQLCLSIVALYTATDLLVETVLRIVEHPDLLMDLRKEIVEALRLGGWQKSTLFEMKLLDSVLKETQRLKPVASAMMTRKVTADVTLPNGLQLRKGERCIVDIGKMSDPVIYPDPEKFDAYRFVRMRNNPELASQAYLISTSPSHLGFGHGKHSCTGRFFAACELKIALAHLLIKYDWKLVPGHEHRWQEYGFDWLADGNARLLVRRREVVEMDIDTI